MAEGKEIQVKCDASDTCDLIECRHHSKHTQDASCDQQCIKYPKTRKGCV